jgi:hypothetical protein
MLNTLAQSARPAFSGAGRFASPIIKEAAHNAAVGVAQVAIVTAGTAVIGATAYGLTMMGRKTMDLVHHLPRLRVEITWDPSWEAERTAAAATEYGSWRPEPAPGTVDTGHSPIDPSIPPGAKPDGGATASI